MKTNKLPKRFKALWVKALNSDKFRPGTGLLYNSKNDTYCCLGVASRICKIPKTKLNDHGLFLPHTFPKKIISKIPPLLVGNFTNPIVQKLSNFNDNGKSFKWIAAYIKRYL